MQNAPICGQNAEILYIEVNKLDLSDGRTPELERARHFSVSGGEIAALHIDYHQRDSSSGCCYYQN